MVALAFAIESPLHAMTIWPMMIGLVPRRTLMTVLPGVGVGEADEVVVLVGDAEPDTVGVVVGDGVAVPVPVAVTEGEGEADGDGLDTTGPPTALPARHT